LFLYKSTDQEHEYNQKAIFMLWQHQGVVHRVVAFGAWGFRWFCLRTGGAIWFRVCNTSNNWNSFTKLRLQVVQKADIFLTSYFA